MLGVFEIALKRLEGQFGDDRESISLVIKGNL